MNKLTKLSSDIILSTLIINPLTNSLSQNNIAQAKNNQVKQIIDIKNTDILNILEQQYNNNKISADDFKTIKSIFQDRWNGPNGQTKVVVFLGWSI